MVWDINFDCDTNVVDVAIRRLRMKVDEPFGDRLIHTIRGGATCWRRGLEATQPRNRVSSLQITLTGAALVRAADCTELLGTWCATGTGAPRRK